jgi:DNA end-binding protein Ku
MARQLVETLAGPFDSERYHDEYREQLRDLIDRKAAGEEIVAEPMVEEPGKVLDLMAALEASLARAGAGSEDEAAKPTPTPAKPSKKRAGRSRKSA